MCCPPHFPVQWGINSTACSVLVQGSDSPNFNASVPAEIGVRLFYSLKVESDSPPVIFTMQHFIIPRLSQCQGGHFSPWACPTLQERRRASQWPGFLFLSHNTPELPAVVWGCASVQFVGGGGVGWLCDYILRISLDTHDAGYFLGKTGGGG